MLSGLGFSELGRLLLHCSGCSHQGQENRASCLRGLCLLQPKAGNPDIPLEKTLQKCSVSFRFQQLHCVVVGSENAKRYFEAVQGSKEHRGELFGIGNLFKLRSQGSCLTRDILEV